MINVQIPKNNEENLNNPVVLIYKDKGSLLFDSEPIEVALYFKNKKEAKDYKKQIIIGKEANIEILPLRYV